MEPTTPANTPRVRTARSTLRTAATGDSWAADDTLFSQRPPIISHRASRSRSRNKRLTAAALALVAAALAGRAFANPIRPRPSQTQRVVAPPLPGQTTTQTSADDQIGDPVQSSWFVSFNGTPSTTLSAPTSVTPPRLAASTSHPAAYPSPAPPPPPPTTAPTPPEPTSPDPPISTAVAPADGLIVQVVSKASDQHFGVAEDSISDGALIVQTTATGPAEQWRLIAASGGCYQLANALSGKALDDPNGSRTNGTLMQQWTIVAGDRNQIWCFQSVGDGRYSIRNLASGSLLDLTGGLRGDGVGIQEWGANPAAPDANQTWQLNPGG